MTAMFLRHLAVRLRMVATDPGAVVILVLCGFSTIPIWRSGLGISGTGFNPVYWPHVISFLLWVPLVAVASRGGFLRPSSAVGVMPALPIGARSRTAAEALVAIIVVLAARTVGLALGLDPFGGIGSSVRVALNTLLGVLLVLPLLLIWTAVPRLEPQLLLKPCLMSAILYVAMTKQAMAKPWTAAALSATLSTMALLLVGHEPAIRLPKMLERRRKLCRASSGPLTQLRHDQWLGTLGELWPLLLVALSLPWLARTLTGLMDSELTVATFRLVALVQFTMFSLVFMYPFGVSLASSAGSGAASRGSFLRAWSVLPVRPESVIRGVYVQALIASSVVWALLYAYTTPRLALFELPIVLLAPAIVVCEAVGDRRRGVLAIASLMAFQFGLPMFVRSALDIGLTRMPWWGFAIAYMAALIGATPPLAHLRPQGRS